MRVITRCFFDDKKRNDNRDNRDPSRHKHPNNALYCTEQK
jgi:hypothetical protein